MEKLFKLKEHNTSVKTELLAGLTTFLTMAYILIVNPLILSDAGMDFGAVFTATALASAIATLVMAFLANLPFALAPGMGLNAFFAYTVVLGMGYSWQFALTAVFLEGILFIVLTMFNIREAIVKPAPSGIMFSDGIRLSGIELLAKHRIREGMPLCIEIMDIDKWGKRDRISRCLNTLGTYGAAAKPMLPRLRQLEKDLLAHSEAKMLQPQIDQLRSLIKDVENATGSVELRGMN